MQGFSVTYERYSPEDAENGEAGEYGHVVRDVPLRDALAECDDLPQWAHASEADEWPIVAPRTFYFHDYNSETHDNYTTGVSESRALHVPEHVTPASRRRIARLLRLRVR